MRVYLCVRPQEICQIKGDVTNVPMMLVGNKYDEVDGRDVSVQEANAVAKAWKCGYIETSAKTNHNVKELFQELMNSDKTRSAAMAGDKKVTKGSGGGKGKATEAVVAKSKASNDGGGKAKAATSATAAGASDKGKSAPGGAGKTKAAEGDGGKKRATGGQNETPERLKGKCSVM